MEDAYLVLSISVYGSAVHFEFKAEEIPLHEMDVFFMQVDDLHDDIREMKKSLEQIENPQVQIVQLEGRVKALLEAPRMTGQFISLRSTDTELTESQSGYVLWPIVVHNTAPEIFSVGVPTAALLYYVRENDCITVNQPGVYQVHVRLGMSNSEGGTGMSLSLNDLNIASAVLTSEENCTSTAQITETLVLKANDYLRVENETGEYGSITLNSVFTVLKLA